MMESERTQSPERQGSRHQPLCPGTGLPAETVQVLGVRHPVGTCTVCAAELRLDDAGLVPQHAAALPAQPV
jgi:hypothetical protein